MSVKGVDLVWPGGEHHFCLPIDHLRALEQKCDAGPAWILARLTSQQYRVDDIIQTIRLGLEGGGMSKKDAAKLVTQHVEDRPLTLSVMTAQAILMATLYGDESESDDQDDDGDEDSPGETEAAA